MNLIFLGAPGAGKGTAAEGIATKYSFASISTGAILREAIKNETELGLKAKSIIEAGELVPDDVIINIVKERIKAEDCKGGFILDGVPRTLEQAAMLDELGVIIDRVIQFDIEPQIVVDRLTGRRVCVDCGDTFHIESKPPEKDGICDRCSGHLIIRKDDEPSTIKERLRVYDELTKPLTEYYTKTGKLIHIDASKSIDEILSIITKALEL